MICVYNTYVVTEQTSLRGRFFSSEEPDDLILLGSSFTFPVNTVHPSRLYNRYLVSQISAVIWYRHHPTLLSGEWQLRAKEKTSEAARFSTLHFREGTDSYRCR